MRYEESVSDLVQIKFTFRNSHPEVFLGKVLLKICSKFTGDHPCRSVISIKLLCSFTEITLRHWCSPVNVLHIFRTPFPRNKSGWLLLYSRNVYFLSPVSPICMLPMSSLIFLFDAGRKLNVH